MSKSNWPHGRILRPLVLAFVLLVLFVQQGSAQAVQPPVGPPITPPGTPGSPPDNYGQQVRRLYQLDDARVPPDAPVRAAAAPTSGDYRITALDSGYRWSTTSLTYSFYKDSVFNGSYYGSEKGVREVSEAVKTNVRQIMIWYGTLMNVTFQEVTETQNNIGLIRFMLSNDPSYAYAYYPYGASMFTLAGDVHLNPVYDRLGDTNGFQHPAGQHGYVSLAHEIGHTLGLKHPHERPALPAAEDNNTNTIMTYQFLGNSPATPMVYDLLALHHIYGAKLKWTGDGTYGFTSRGTDQYALAGTTYMNTSYRTQQTIWDSAGTEMLDFSGLPYASGGYRLDLKPGGWLAANADYRTNYYDSGTSIGPNVTIESVVGSASADTIYANASANTFRGYDSARVSGNDVIYDADASDTVDLSGYAQSLVAQTKNVNDLILGMGSNGSITLKDYYANTGKTPSIVYSQGPANKPPIALATASTTIGTAPLTVAFTGSGSSDPDGSIASYFWSFGDGATSNVANPSHTYQSAGSYTATLTVTDNAGATALASVAVSVSASPQETIHVSGIVMSQVDLGKDRAARAVVKVADSQGNPILGATVTGSWSGVVTGTGSGMTNPGGEATITSRNTKRTGTVTFKVTGVTAAGYSYDATDTTTSGTITLIR